MPVKLGAEAAWPGSSVTIKLRATDAFATFPETDMPGTQLYVQEKNTFMGFSVDMEGMVWQAVARRHKGTAAAAFQAGLGR